MINLKIMDNDKPIELNELTDTGRQIIRGEALELLNDIDLIASMEAEDG